MVFLVYQYCLKMWYLRSLDFTSVIQKLTIILERKNGLVLSNTRVPVSRTFKIHFPPPKVCTTWLWNDNTNKQGRSQPHSPGWASVPLPSFFLKFLSIILIFPQIFLINFSSSFWPSWWATRTPGKALATPLPTRGLTGHDWVHFTHSL